MPSRSRKPRMTTALHWRRKRQQAKRKVLRWEKARTPSDPLAALISVLGAIPDELLDERDIYQIRRVTELVNANQYAFTRPGPHDPLADWPAQTDFEPGVPPGIRAPCRGTLERLQATANGNLLTLRCGHVVDPELLPGIFIEGAIRLLYRCETQGCPQAGGEWSSVLRPDLKDAIPSIAFSGGYERAEYLLRAIRTGSGVLSALDIFSVRYLPLIRLQMDIDIPTPRAKQLPRWWKHSPFRIFSKDYENKPPTTRYQHGSSAAL